MIARIIVILLASAMCLFAQETTRYSVVLVPEGTDPNLFFSGGGSSVISTTLATNYIFSAVITNSAANYAVGTTTKLLFSNPTINNGSAFNIASNGFIVPFDGIYNFSAFVHNAEASRVCTLQLYTNGAVYSQQGNYDGGIGSGASYEGGIHYYESGPVLLPLGCVVQVYLKSTYNTGTFTINTGGVYSCFSGWLMPTSYIVSVTSSGGNGSGSTGNSFSNLFYVNKLHTSQSSAGDTVYSKVTFTNEAYDLISWYDPVNSKFTVQRSGNYMFEAQAVGNGGAPTFITLHYLTNGLLAARGGLTYSYASGTYAGQGGVRLTSILNLSSGTYVEVYSYINDGYNTGSIWGDTTNTWWKGYYLGP